MGFKSKDLESFEESNAEVAGAEEIVLAIAALAWTSNPLAVGAASATSVKVVYEPIASSWCQMLLETPIAAKRGAESPVEPFTEAAEGRE